MISWDAVTLDCDGDPEALPVDYLLEVAFRDLYGWVETEDGLQPLYYPEDPADVVFQTVLLTPLTHAPPETVPDPDPGDVVFFRVVAIDYDAQRSDLPCPGAC